MGRAIQPADFSLTQVFALYRELQIGRVGIEEPVTTDHKLDHISTTSPCNCRGRLELYELNFALDRLGLDVRVVQTIGYNSVCHVCTYRGIFFESKQIIIINLLEEL